MNDFSSVRLPPSWYSIEDAHGPRELDALHAWSRSAEGRLIWWRADPAKQHVLATAEMRTIPSLGMTAFDLAAAMGEVSGAAENVEVISLGLSRLADGRTAVISRDLIALRRDPAQLVARARGSIVIEEEQMIVDFTASTAYLAYREDLSQAVAAFLNTQKQTGARS